MKPKNKLIIIPFLIVILLLQVNAFTTNGTGKTFDFVISSGKNNQVSSGNFTSYLVVGETASSTIDSTNFKTELGFMKITGLIVGDTCELNISCVNSVCCNGICQAICGSIPPPPTGLSEVSRAHEPLTEHVPQDKHVQYFASIGADEEITININKEELAVSKLTFEVSEYLTAVTITIKTEESPSTTIEDSYQYFSIQSDKINSNNLKSSIIQFKVRIDSDYIKDSVRLNYYDNKWIELPTEFIREDSIYYYYESPNKGFGLFAITGQKIVQPFVEELAPPEVFEEVPERIIEVPEIVELKKLPPIKGYIYANKSFVGFILAALLISAAVLVYGLKRIKYEHEEDIYNKFYDLLYQVNFYIKNNKMNNAVNAYKKLWLDYIEFMSYPIKEKIKIDMYEKVRHVYDELNRIKKWKYNETG